MKQPKQLKESTMGLMISTALFFDALQASVQLVWILGQILAGLVAIYAFLTFWLWFRLYGIKFSTPKRSAVMGGGFIIELIPILNVLPAWTLAVTIIILDIKAKNIASKAVESVTKGGGNVENKKAT